MWRDYMNYVYHGSKTKGLKIIKKRVSSHQKEWVYATLSKAVSVIFINNGGSDLNYFLGGKGTEESPIVLVERKAGMFEQIFNLSGSLYILDNKNFQTGQTGWSAEVVSDFEENVIHEEAIDNVLNKISELAKNNELILYRFPDRPNYIPLDNSDLIPRIITQYKNGRNIDKFIELYPELESKFHEQLEQN